MMGDYHVQFFEKVRSFIRQLLKSYFTLIISAFFTAFYSFRLIYLTFLVKTNAYKSVVLQAHEGSFLLSFPLFFLCIGSIFFGYLFKDLFIGIGSQFFGNSIFILPKNYNMIDAEFLPLVIKMIPFFFSLCGIGFSFLINYYFYNNLLSFQLTNLGLFLFKFFNQK
jgi:NADH-ubiquinone oxidoreductase chain 5